MNHPYANFVISCLIKIFPEIMLFKVGTELFSMFENEIFERGLRFLVAFLQTGNLDIEDKIFSQMYQSETLQKLLLKRTDKRLNFPHVILKFVNSSKWADKIAMFLLQNGRYPRNYLPPILACSNQHHMNLIQADYWIASNFSEEEINFALGKK